jgi:hypothetical protein
MVSSASPIATASRHVSERGTLDQSAHRRHRSRDEFQGILLQRLEKCSVVQMPVYVIQHPLHPCMVS